MILDSLSTLPGLMPAMYRGIPFHVTDTSSESGRRLLEYLFPGVDAAAYDDFGVLPNVVSIDAIVVGDEYIVVAKALQAAFEAPGPGTLIHPWLGPMTVMMEEPAELRFSARELRVVRIRAVFKRIMPSTTLSLLGLSGIASAISGVLGAAVALVDAVGSLVISVAGAGAVLRSGRILVAAIADLRAPNGSGRFLSDLRSAVAGATPAAVSEFGALVTSASAGMAVVALTPAVAPAAEAITAATSSPESIMEIGLRLSDHLAAEATSAPADPDLALLVGASAQFLANSATQSSYATYASRREALAYRARTSATIGALVEALSPLGSTLFQAQATALERALRTLQAAIVADVNEVIGRLPDVLSFRSDRPLDAWQLAQYITGDRPSEMEAVYRDIVARNDPAHPAGLPAGSVEVLDSRR